MTIKDIAKLAGISPAAVSIVINNKTGVSRATRERVLAIISEQGYRSPMKKKAVTDTQNVLFLKFRKHGMLVEDNQGFISTIIDTIETECRSRSFNLNFWVSDDTLKNSLQDIDYGQYAGVLVLATEIPSSQYPLLQSIPIPFVVIDNNMQNEKICTVGINNRENVFKSMWYCRESGHREVTYLRSRIFIENFGERHTAFLAACVQLGILHDTSRDILLSPTLIGAYRDMKMYLATNPRLSPCAFADNDSIAIGAIKALQEAGYNIPNDISVIGFDDIPYSSINSPAITTVSVPKDVIGIMAVSQLAHIIDNPRLSQVKIQVSGELIIRDSMCRR